MSLKYCFIKKCWHLISLRAVGASWFRLLFWYTGRGRTSGREKERTRLWFISSRRHRVGPGKILWFTYTVGCIRSGLTSFICLKTLIEVHLHYRTLAVQHAQYMYKSDRIARASRASHASAVVYRLSIWIHWWEILALTCSNTLSLPLTIQTVSESASVYINPLINERWNSIIFVDIFLDVWRAILLRQTFRLTQWPACSEDVQLWTGLA